ncbi:unnamed protein product, partial [Didymodactylos carnosus]
VQITQAPSKVQTTQAPSKVQTTQVPVRLVTSTVSTGTKAPEPSINFHFDYASSDFVVVLPTICPTGTWNSVGTMVGSGSSTLRNVAVDTLTGNVYAAHGVVSNGQLLKVAVPYTVIASSLTFPWGVAVDHYSNIYVAYGTRVNKYPGGILVAGGTGTIASPQIAYGIYVDCFGAIYVADHGYHRIQLWANSSVGVTIIGNDTPGSGPNQVDGPIDVKVDRQGNIYVLDRSHSHLRHPFKQRGDDQ